MAFQRPADLVCSVMGDSFRYSDCGREEGAESSAFKAGLHFSQEGVQECLRLFKGRHLSETFG